MTFKRYCVYRQTHRQTDRQTDRRMDRQTDRQTDGQTNRQTERQTSKNITILLYRATWPTCNNNRNDSRHALRVLCTCTNRTSDIDEKSLIRSGQKADQRSNPACLTNRCAVARFLSTLTQSPNGINQHLKQFFPSCFVCFSPLSPPEPILNCLIN